MATGNQLATIEPAQLPTFTEDPLYVQLKDLLRKIKEAFTAITNGDIGKLYELKQLLSEFSNFREKNPDIFGSGSGETLQEKIDRFNIMSLYFESIPEIKTIVNDLPNLMERFNQKSKLMIDATFARLRATGYIKD